MKKLALLLILSAVAWGQASQNNFNAAGQFQSYTSDPTTCSTNPNQTWYNTTMKQVRSCSGGQPTSVPTPIRNALAIGGTNGSAVSNLLTLANWAAGTFYNGTTGATSHADWVQAACTADGTNKLYIWENIGGDIAVASVNPNTSGTCTAGAQIADGNGNWQLIALSGFPVTLLSASGTVLTVTTSATGLTSAPALGDNNRVIIAGCTEAANLFANTGVGFSGSGSNVAPVYTVNAGSEGTSSFTANYTTVGATGAASSSCQAYVVNNYSNGANSTKFMVDEFSHKVLPYVSGIKIQLAANSFDAGTYNGTQAPTFGNWTSADATINQNGFLTDPQWKAGVQPKYILFSVAHQQDGGGTTGNTLMPSYIATQNYANSIKVAWKPSTKYLFGQYVFVTATGHYQQMTGNAASSVCGSSSGAAPSFSSAGGTVTEGSSTLNLPACKWFDFGTSAPPQDYFTCAGNLGNSAMQQLALGEYNITTAALNTCTLGAGASGHCNEADLTTAYPAWWEMPYMTAVEAEDVAVIQRYGSTALGWGPSVINSIQFGELAVGQSFPYCAAFIQGSNVLNLPNAGTIAGIPNWVTFHTAALHPYYYNRSNTASQMGLPAYFVGSSPQSNNSATDTADPTALANAEAADMAGPATAPSGLADPNYPGGLNMSLGFDGLQASDVATLPNYLHANMSQLAAYWCRLNVHQCYTEQIAPGSYDGATGGGRLDYNMRFSQSMKIKNFGMYGSDFWCIDPQNVLYAYCGQSYLGALQAFETDSTVQALTFQGQYIDQAYNTSAAVGSITATVAQMGAPNFVEATFNLTGTMTANQTITLPGTTALFQAMNPLDATVTNFNASGSSYKLRIMNSSAGNYTRTVQAAAGASGWTLTGNMVIPAGTYSDFYINFTAGSTATMQYVGSGPIVPTPLSGLTTGVAQTIFSQSLAADNNISVSGTVTVYAINTTNHQNCVDTVFVQATAENSGGVFVGAAPTLTPATPITNCTAGVTLTLAFTWTAAGTTTLSVTPTTGSFTTTPVISVVTNLHNQGTAGQTF